MMLFTLAYFAFVAWALRHQWRAAHGKGKRA